MNPLKAALTWLLTKHVKKEKKLSEPLNDTAAEQTAIVESAPAVIDNPAIVAEPLTPLEVTKDGVEDFEKALHFVRDGIAKLGEEAESELIELAKKYL